MQMRRAAFIVPSLRPGAHRATREMQGTLWLAHPFLPSALLVGSPRWPVSRCFGKDSKRAHTPMAAWDSVCAATEAYRPDAAFDGDDRPSLPAAGNHGATGAMSDISPQGSIGRNLGRSQRRRAAG